jgi:type I restriction enzyme, S subunit
MSEAKVMLSNTRVTLGDVAEERSVREARPGESKYTRFVGSEHVGRYDLRVKRWGASHEVTSAVKVFHEGDYLFVRRSLYASDFRERAPRAGFSGLCSGDMLTLRERSEIIVNGFLGAALNDPRLWSFVAAHATGSITRRIKWKELKDYSFKLPPAEEQQRIVDALNAAADLEASLDDVVRTSRRLLDAALLAIFSRVRDRVALSELSRVPITYGIVQAGPDTPNGVPYVRVSEMTGRDELNPDDMMRTSTAISESYRRTVLERDDIVVALRGVPGLCHLVKDKLVGANLSRGVARIAPNSQVNPQFLLWALRSYQSQAAIRQYANGWKGEDLREITIGQLRSVRVPWVARVEQDAIVEELSSLHDAWVASRERSSQFADVVTDLRNQISGRIE